MIFHTSLFFTVRKTPWANYSWRPSGTTGRSFESHAQRQYPDTGNWTSFEFVLFRYMNEYAAASLWPKVANQAEPVLDKVLAILRRVVFLVLIFSLRFLSFNALTLVCASKIGPPSRNSESPLIPVGMDASRPPSDLFQGWKPWILRTPEHFLPALVHKTKSRKS